MPQRGIAVRLAAQHSPNHAIPRIYQVEYLSKVIASGQIGLDCHTFPRHSSGHGLAAAVVTVKSIKVGSFNMSEPAAMKTPHSVKPSGAAPGFSWAGEGVPAVAAGVAPTVAAGGAVGASGVVVVVAEAEARSLAFPAT